MTAPVFTLPLTRADLAALAILINRGCASICADMQAGIGLKGDEGVANSTAVAVGFRLSDQLDAMLNGVLP
jgi:hypothetical protein